MPPPTRAMPDSWQSMPPAGLLAHPLQARAAVHDMAGTLAFCSWCGLATVPTDAGTVMCPVCDERPS